MDQNIEKQRLTYMRGMCDAMAVALARRTGLPLGLIQGKSRIPEEEWACEDEPEFDVVPCHAVVIVDPAEPAWLDVNGLNHGLDHDFRFGQPMDEVVLEPASEEEVRFAFAFASGVSDEQIADAEAFVDRYPPLRQVVTDLAAASTPAPR